jgi:hypothetical protein
VLVAGGNFAYSRPAHEQENIPPQLPLPGVQNVPEGERIVPEPILNGTPVQPPQQNSGWDAQQCVFDALTEAGWSVYDVSRQQLGCDLLAKKGQRTIFVEVKSSLSTCAPSLTSREWQQAQRYQGNYILAVVERFDPAAMNTVFWIPNPASTCRANPLTTLIYAISRSVWTTAICSLANI